MYWLHNITKNRIWNKTMKAPARTFVWISAFAIFHWACADYGQKSRSKNGPQIPYLAKQGNATQLVVEGGPFIVRGGELGNSTFTSVENMAPVWPRLKALNLNTILVPVYWELIEPDEGEFHFNLYDRLIDEARENDLKLVLLWFASWKNSMSSHAPPWVKTNQEKYPRAKDEQGISQEILTPFSENNLRADMNAFKALMAHIKKIDYNRQTVIMIQPENEIGMLPSARDHSASANTKFNGPVPQELIRYLSGNKENLVPEFLSVWGKNGYKTEGTWEEIFGKGAHTDEIFMAWTYARFTNAIIEAGKAIYPLPMFVNAALNRPDRKPGTGYPSAGPLPHIMDVWMAGAPSVDLLAPDIYFPNIEYWCDLYTRQGNPLFIPEAGADPSAAAKALFTIGRYESLGYSPFSVESIENPENTDLRKAYDLVEQIAPLIAARQGQGKINGVLLDKQKQETQITFGKYVFMVKHSHTLGYEREARDEYWIPGGAIIIQTGENEFYVAGSGIVITFTDLSDPEQRVGILKTEEGRFHDKAWKVVRYLNGDQTHQGRHIRIFRNNFSIQRFELYEYK
jgi:beta-galactosidase GanA